MQMELWPVLDTDCKVLRQSNGARSPGWKNIVKCLIVTITCLRNQTVLRVMSRKKKLTYRSVEGSLGRFESELHSIDF